VIALVQSRTGAALGVALALACLGAACDGTHAASPPISPVGNSKVQPAGAPSPSTASPTVQATPSTSSPPPPEAVVASPAASGFKPLAGRTVLIDPGHNGGNGSSPAAINRQVWMGTGYKACDTTGTSTDAGYPESAFTLDVSRRLSSLLTNAGARVVLTRTSDTGVGPCVNERAAAGTAAHADAAISIHADGGPASGYGFHVLLPADIGSNSAIVAPSRQLGLDIRASYAAGTHEAYSTYYGDQGLAVRSDLGGLNLSQVPKVFIECANMRNAVDASLVTSADFRQKAADALAVGLTTYLISRP
jgi:N-acetylmuramoyl-L-alanine amidase